MPSESKEGGRSGVGQQGSCLLGQRAQCRKGSAGTEKCGIVTRSNCRRSLGKVYSYLPPELLCLVLP